MKNYYLNFKDKKITVMGLGLLGRGLNVVKFLADCGAELTVTDLKSKKELAPSLRKLKKYKNIKYVLGKHRLADFRGKDMIIKSAGVPLNSPYIKEAKKYGVPVEMDASLFAKTTGATIIGITGTKGKTTVTNIIYKILKKAGKKVELAGNIPGIATLPLLKKVDGDYFIVAELDSWQLQGFASGKISPKISVFTNFMPDHMNYYAGSMAKYFKDKSAIFKNQKENDYLVVTRNSLAEIKNRYRGKIKSQIVKIKQSNIPKNWKVPNLGEHNKENMALALGVADVLGIKRSVSKKVLENFKSVPGRGQYLGDIKGVKVINDNNATTPDATLANLKIFGKERKVILIMGGSDKGLGFGELLREMSKYTKKVVLIPGSGTKKISKKISGLVETKGKSTLNGAFKEALKNAHKGDTILFSPAFASFGLFKNEYEREEEFLRIFKNAKD